ncbi:MAG: 4Fe-4S dicluster domain-containing protein [Coriobacteriales bacterium]|jgi:Fe-S-cluster-containing dehydrogenase component
MNALFLDYEFCSGCHSCELACRNELGLGLGEWGIKVHEDGPRQNKDDDWHWNYYAIPTELCDMCEQRVAGGELPSCVQVCQGRCLKFGTVEDCAKMLEEKGGMGLIMMP